MTPEADSLYELFGTFQDEQSCLDHLASIRWRDGKFCPHCGSLKIYDFSDRKTFKCGDCRQRFSVKVGTIFQDTKLPLRKWFMAIWMITNQPKGIASTTLAKVLKITQKSAWHVLHRLRHAARTRSFNAPLGGVVEADVTYIGGKEKNRRAKDRKGGKQGGAGKEAVIGVVEREGDLRAFHVDDTKAKTLQAVVHENVEPGAALMTDEDRSFRGLDNSYVHLSVNHSAGEYTRLGNFVHTNTIEGVWSQLKRQIIGVHHWVSPAHLNRYVGEMAWRYNRRECRTGERLNNLLTCVEGPMPYKILIA